MIPRDVLELLILAILSVIDSRYLYGFPGRRDSANSYTMDVEGDPGYIYVRIVRGGQELTLAKALNMGGTPNPNILVRMERRNGKLIVVDADPTHALYALGDNVAMANVPKHRHFIGSGMEDPVEGQRILPGLISPSTSGGLNVKIEAFHHPGGYFAGDDDFLIDDPASNYAAVGVYVDISTNTAGYLVGATHTNPNDITDEDLLVDLAAHPIGIMPCGAVIVANGQTQITSADRFLDWRFHNAGDAASTLDVAAISSATPVLADKALFGDVSASDALRYATWQSIFNLVDSLTQETAPAVGDKVPLYDVSASNTDYITLSNFFKVIDGLTAETAPDSADELVLYDASAATADKITLANLFKVITTLSALTAPDSADELVIYDASAGSALKITLSNFFKAINTLASETAPATDDKLLLYDTSASSADAISLSDFFKVINSFTTETTIDPSADRIPIYDSSEGAINNVAPENLPAKEIVKVRNTSGATANAKEVGYLDPTTGDYKTTTTATLYTPKVCVVHTGGANNADIYVQVRGRCTAKYTGTDVSAGNYLVFSTTAGKGQQQTTIRPEVFAIVPTGATIDTGNDEAEVILLHDEPMVLESSTDLYAFVSASTSDFVATINGAPSGTSVVYNAPSSGNENVIPPNGTLLAKMVLYNTTRGDSAQISSVNTGTNTITLTATVPAAWANGDTITVRSQTNTDVPAGYFLDFAIDDTSLIPANAVMLDFVFHTVTDTGGVALILAHPFKAGVASARRRQGTQVASVSVSSGMFRIAFLQRRFELEWQATGAGTQSAQLRIMGCVVKVP